MLIKPVRIDEMVKLLNSIVAETGGGFYGSD